VFSKRLIQPEILDDAPPEVARGNLADLVRINRYFGGHSAIRRLLASSVKDLGTFSVLDVGAASGDTGRLITSLYPGANVTNLDHNAVNLQSADYPKLIADAFHLPFQPESFDFVLSSLFLHHFEDDQVVSLLRGMYRIARCAVLIADLERHILPYIFLPLSRPLFKWGDITVHDGVRSVRAAFKVAELQSLAIRAGIADPVVESYRPAFRLTLRGEKPAWRMTDDENQARVGVAEPAPGR
jgi:2-polyprenyl-3-methyl-5-hydroxy-6-metoxy-1,4-benzoquinol methylase